MKTLTFLEIKFKVKINRKSFGIGCLKVMFTSTEMFKKCLNFLMVKNSFYMHLFIKKKLLIKFDLNQGMIIFRKNKISLSEFLGKLNWINKISKLNIYQFMFSLVKK